MISIEPDAYVPGAVTVAIDGREQSHVNLDDPTRLFFDYVRRMGNVIDAIGDPGSPITTVHLGAGGLTLPRYVQATRPGSRQWVIERDPTMVSEVVAALPLPHGAVLGTVTGDARDASTLLPGELHGRVDVLVDDFYSGGPVIEETRSRGFLRSLSALLAPSGVLLVNLPIGPELSVPRARTADVLDTFPFVTLLGGASGLVAGTDGNLVLAASARPFSPAERAGLQAAGPHPAVLLDGAELASWAHDGSGS
ncbi:spermidine synthase [Planctomonas psychrotolerans]|uniref:spermidine synthase n=1 Tax=Planctomonas psychrotolerans TaxID=2528712 RepID=UPI0012392D72|nr:hypothetical protein [Planctomonas psychrotolerans]